MNTKKSFAEEELDILREKANAALSEVDGRTKFIYILTKAEKEMLEAYHSLAPEDQEYVQKCMYELLEISEEENCVY